MCPLLSPLAVPGTVLVCARWSGFTRQHSQQCPGLPPKCSGYPTYKNSLLALPTFISSHASQFVMLSLHCFLIQIGSPLPRPYILRRLELCLCGHYCVSGA